MRCLTLLLIIFLASCTKPTISGHWKCDNTGLVKGLNKNNEMQTEPISKFYELLKIKPLEFVLSEDGNAKSISTKLSGAISEISLSVIKNHNGDAFKFLLSNELDHSDDVIMTLKSLTKDKMEASFDLVNNETILDLKLDRVK